MVLVRRACARARLITFIPLQCQVIRELKGGSAMALVSDAGMPAINDPGAQLIAAAVEEGVAVVPVPGPSATLAALVASGLPTASFTFCGFAESKGGARRQQLEGVKGAFFAWFFQATPDVFFIPLN